PVALCTRTCRTVCALSLRPLKLMARQGAHSASAVVAVVRVMAQLGRDSARSMSAALRDRRTGIGRPQVEDARHVERLGPDRRWRDRVSRHKCDFTFGFGAGF